VFIRWRAGVSYRAFNRFFNFSVWEVPLVSVRASPKQNDG
jgi:hypothetical protein